MFDSVVVVTRTNLDKRYASEPDFKRAFDAEMVQLLTRSTPEQLNQRSA